MRLLAIKLLQVSSYQEVLCSMVITNSEVHAVWPAGIVDDFDNLVNLLLITISSASKPESLQELLNKADLKPQVNNHL